MKADAVYSLHVFCDASARAYGVAAYLQCAPFSGIIQSHLLFSKTRVAPVKPLTIPRLELMAAVLGSCVIHLLRKELHLTCSFQQVVLWSDSTTVLHWLQSSDHLPSFIKSRVARIKFEPDHLPVCSICIQPS